MSKPFERSEMENNSIREIRGSIRRIKRKLQDIDWFDNVHGSDDASIIPKICEKVLAAEKLLQEAQSC